MMIFLKLNNKWKTIDDFFSKFKKITNDDASKFFFNPNITKSVENRLNRFLKAKFVAV